MRTDPHYFEAILNASAESIFLVDVQGLVLTVNETAAQRLNQNRADMIGKFVSDFFPPDTAAVRKRNFEEVLSSGLPVHTEDTRAGRFFSLDYYPVKDDSGKVNAVAVYAAEITARKQAEEALRKSENRYRRFADDLPLGIVITQEGLITYVNHATVRMIGYSLDEILGKPFIPFVYEADRPWLLDLHKRRMAGETVEPSYFVNMVRKDGEVRLWNMHASTIEWDGRISALGSCIDVTESRKAEDVVKASEEKYRALVETTGMGYLIIDQKGNVLDANQEYVRLTGHALLRDILGRSVMEWTAPYEKEKTALAVAKCARGNSIKDLVINYVAGNGQTLPIEVNATVVGEGDSLRIIALCRDITERKEMEDQVRQLAFYDALTKLPNRRLLDDRLSQTMALSKRSGCYGALLFLDLDNFKPLNDAHGHAAGDLLLIQVADRLTSCVRQADTVVRFGGDEFVVILSNLSADRADSILEAKAVAEKIRMRLAEPYQLSIHHKGKADAVIEHHCTVSIGTTLFLNHESSQDDILKWADAAMYEAKAAGRNSIWFFDAKV